LKIFIAAKEGLILVRLNLEKNSIKIYSKNGLKILRKYGWKIDKYGKKKAA
jgi:hypothetical protein